MRISDWSSDVCSSDLLDKSAGQRVLGPVAATGQRQCAAKGQAGRLVAGCMVGVIEAEPKGYGLVSAVANIRDLRGRHKLLAHVHAPPTIRAPKPKPSAASSRSEERRVGDECVSTCRSRGAP